MYRQAENVMLLEMDISPPTMFMLNLNGPHLDRAYTPRLIPDLLANIPLRERSGSSSRVRKSQSWWVSEWVAHWFAPFKLQSAFDLRTLDVILVMFIIIECVLLRSAAQVPGATCIPYGLVLIVHRLDIRISESFSFSKAKAVLCCLPSTGQFPREQPLTPVIQHTCTQGRTSVQPGTTIEGRNALIWDRFFFPSHIKKSNSFSMHALTFKTRTVFSWFVCFGLYEWYIQPKCTIKKNRFNIKVMSCFLWIRTACFCFFQSS